MVYFFPKLENNGIVFTFDTEWLCLFLRLRKDEDFHRKGAETQRNYQMIMP